MLLGDISNLNEEQFPTSMKQKSFMYVPNILLCGQYILAIISFPRLIMNINVISCLKLSNGKIPVLRMLLTQLIMLLIVCQKKIKILKANSCRYNFCFFNTETFCLFLVRQGNNLKHFISPNQGIICAHILFYINQPGDYLYTF